VEHRSAPLSPAVGPQFSVSDPALAAYFHLGGIQGLNNITVNDETALGISAFWRGVSLIAGTIAAMPLKTYERTPNGKIPVPSWLDNPSGPYMLSPFGWVERILMHLLMRGEAFLQLVYNQGGELVGANVVHPAAVSVRWMGISKVYTATFVNGTSQRLVPPGDPTEEGDGNMLQIMGLSLDGLRGASPLTLFRHGVALAIAGEQAAGKVFSDGLLVSGLVSPEDDMNEGDAATLMEDIRSKGEGVENAGGLLMVNRKMKFTPWSLTPEDAQFLQSRQFSVLDVSRLFGIPPHLLAAMEAQSSWGTGIAEQNLALQKYTLQPWTTRVEQSLSALLPANQFCEFDYKGLLQGTPKEEIDLIMAQMAVGLLTWEEARELMGRDPDPALKPVVSVVPAETVKVEG
jgi:HK97 family phage portal protein